MRNHQPGIVTDQHQRAIEPINEMFDRLDHLMAARGQLTGIEPIGSDEDPVHDAESLLEHAKRLIDTVSNLRAAAVADADHRRRTDLGHQHRHEARRLVPSDLHPLRRDSPRRLSEPRIPAQRLVARRSKLTMGTTADPPWAVDDAMVRAVVDRAAGHQMLLPWRRERRHGDGSPAAGSVHSFDLPGPVELLPHRSGRTSWPPTHVPPVPRPWDRRNAPVPTQFARPTLTGHAT
jgi:hypothetical protein